MISWFAALMLCFCSAVIGINTAGYAFAPEKYPLNFMELFGWVLFAAAIIVWEIARRP